MTLNSQLLLTSCPIVVESVIQFQPTVVDGTVQFTKTVVDGTVSFQPTVVVLDPICFGVPFNLTIGGVELTIGGESLTIAA